MLYFFFLKKKKKWKESRQHSLVIYDLKWCETKQRFLYLSMQFNMFDVQKEL